MIRLIEPFYNSQHYQSVNDLLQVTFSLVEHLYIFIKFLTPLPLKLYPYVNHCCYQTYYIQYNFNNFNKNIIEICLLIDLVKFNLI